LDGLGFTVFAGVRQQSDYQRLSKTLSTRSKAIILDVTSKTSITEAVNTIANHLEKVNIGLVGLVNNAGRCCIFIPLRVSNHFGSAEHLFISGICVLGPIECVPEDELRYNFQVNLFGLINTTNAFSPLLRAGHKFPANPNFPQSIATIIHWIHNGKGDAFLLWTLCNDEICIRGINRFTKA